jgi:hypothetical protein
VSAPQTTPPESSPAVIDPSLPDDPDEKHLTEEIGQLWKAHAKAQGNVRLNRDELKLIRTNLALHLRDLKLVLSRPGRGGAWSSFLAAQKIPRSTADRLVRGYEKTLGADGKNRTTEHINEPTEVAVGRYLRGLWPRLRRVLTTRESVDLFIAILRETAEKSFAANGESSESPEPEDLSADPAS